MISIYSAILRGFVVLGIAGAISQGNVFEAREAARKSVKHGLVKLQDLNRRVGVRADP